MGNTIAVCIPTMNDIESLRVSIPYAIKWADQVVITDSGSKDGTLEFLKWFLRPQDTVINVPERESVAASMDMVRNIAAAEAKTDWVLSMDADCLLHPSDMELLKLETGLQGGVGVLRIQRLNVVVSTFNIWQAEQAIESATLESEPKDWLYRAHAGYLYRGYIHEELYLGDSRAVGRHTNIRVYHLSRIKPLHRIHYQAASTSYRLKMIMLHPELREHVNPYWYEHYYQQHQEYTDDQANHFAKVNGLKLE